MTLSKKIKHQNKFRVKNEKHSLTYCLLFTCLNAILLVLNNPLSMLFGGTALDIHLQIPGKSHHLLVVLKPAPNGVECNFTA